MASFSMRLIGRGTYTPATAEQLAAYRAKLLDRGGPAYVRLNLEAGRLDRVEYKILAYQARLFRRLRSSRERLKQKRKHC